MWKFIKEPVQTPTWGGGKGRESHRTGSQVGREKGSPKNSS